MMEPIITLRSDNVDGCDWEECLGTAFLLATEINEGLRDEVELRKLIQDWGQGEAAVTVLYQPRIVREKRGEGWLTVWYQPMWM